MISWLFEIDSLRLSTKDVTWSSTSYSGVVITDSFSGITMRWDISGNGLIAPNEMEFEVSNTAGTYSVSNFDGKFCIIRLIEDGTNTRTWKFKIDRAIAYYGKITCYCVDFLQEHLTGDYPNTKSQKEIWSSDDFDEEESESDCVPVVLGTAYIPVKSVNTGSARWYVLGESGPTYTVHEVMSPRSWPNSSTWLSSEYTMTGGLNSGYQLLQPIIADSDDDDIADSVGLWRSGDTFYDMLCKFSRNDTASLTNPADWIEYILEDFGVSSSDIDSVSFGVAATLYSSLTIGFNGGGWWEKESRESVLSNILAQTDSFIKCTDKVELYQFDATPVEAITDVLLLSFSPSKITKSTNDSGRVHWPESATSPSDVLNGKATVPTHNGGTETTTSSDILECRFLSGDSIAAQKAGILYFQKKFEQSQKINFSVTFQSLSSKATISPGQVVTINNTLYGGTNNVIITDITINPDMRVDCSGVILNYLEDWGDLTTTAKSVITDSSLGFQLATTNYNGEIEVEAGADWETNLLNIPDRFKETASLGINVTDSYLGYYDGTAFQVFIQNNGNVQFGNPTTGQGFTWNQGTGVCTIQGSLTIVNPADVRLDLNVEDGATRNTGALADLNSVSNSYITSIDGGKITTGTVSADRIDVDDIFSQNITVSGTFTFSGLTNRLYFGGMSSGTWIAGTTSIIQMETPAYGESLAGTIQLGTSNNYVSIGGVVDAIQIRAVDTSSSKIGLIANSDITITASGDIKFNTDDLYIDTSTSRVGIGTTTPSYTLDVAGNVRCQSGYSFIGDGSLLTGITGGYTHPTHPGDDFSVDSGSLTGATVISDIDINVTTDTLGHVTDANGLISTRTLTLADLGYSGVTNADRYYDWNLYVNGTEQKSVYSGNNVKFAAGSNITLAYASDTVTITATNTTYSAGTNLSLSGTTFSLAASPDIGSLYIQNNIVHTGNTGTYIAFTTDIISFYCGSNIILGGTTTGLIATANFIPSATGTYYIGSAVKEWKAIYADAVYRNGTALDVYDDLYELSKIQSKKKKNELGKKTSEETLNEKGMPIIDPLSLPLEFTNYDDIIKKLKEDNCDLLTQEDIDILIQDDEEAGWMLKINFALLSDLTTGAVRQLDTDMISMFNLLSERITMLENKGK